MGAWGVGSFENDDASDWLAELCEGEDAGPIADALNTIVEGGDEYIESPDCSMAIAAAELIAASRGRQKADLPDEAKDWLARHHVPGDEGLVNLALGALARIRSNSELKELWNESESSSGWYEAIVDSVHRRGSSKEIGEIFRHGKN
jgi:hypothetical protein